MRRRRPHRRAAQLGEAVLLTPRLALLIASAAVGCTSTPDQVAERSWTEVSTRHFRVLSEVSGERTVRIVRRLERFRSAVHRLTGVPPAHQSPRARVYVFANDRSFREFRPAATGRNLLGYFVDRAHAPYIAMVAGDDRQARGVVFHEYVHLLLARSDLPTWYEEGVAEILSTFRVRDGFAQVGLPLADRLAELRDYAWRSDEEILSITPESPGYRELAPSFHSQAWGLAHYFLLGAPQRLPQLDDYLARWRRGEDPGSAFTRSFGVPYDVLWRDVVAHLDTSDFPYGDFPSKDLDSGGEPTLRPSSTAQTRSALGDLLFQIGSFHEAAALFSAAGRADPKLALPYAGLGTLLDLSSRLTEAQPLFARAARLAPDDRQVRLLLADHAFRVAVSRGASGDFDGVRESYHAALPAPSAASTALIRTSLTYLYEPGASDAGRGLLEAAVRELPGNRGLAEVLARLLVKSGRPDQSRGVLARCLRAPPDSDAVESWLSRIERTPAPPLGFDAIVHRLGDRSELGKTG